MYVRKQKSRRGRGCSVLCDILPANRITYLCICRQGCSSHRTGTPTLSFGRTRRCRRTGHRPVGRTQDNSRIRRGCAARPARTPGLCWRTDMGRRSAIGPGNRRIKLMKKRDKTRNRMITKPEPHWSFYAYYYCAHAYPNNY